MKGDSQLLFKIAYKMLQKRFLDFGSKFKLADVLWFLNWLRDRAAFCEILSEILDDDPKSSLECKGLKAIGSVNFYYICFKER